MQPIPETARVLVGVFSFGNSKAARERMRGVRELSDLRHPQLVQRFVSPADEVAELNATDILRFDITRNQRLKLGKYLLQNAFLAFASRLEHLLWVVRADDDVIANASAVTARLLAYSRRDEPYMVYGQFKWYQWHVPTASAACSAASWWGHKSLPAVVNFTANCKPEWPPCDATNVAAPDPTAGPNGGCAPGLCPRLRPHMCHLPDKENCTDFLTKWVPKDKLLKSLESGQPTLGPSRGSSRSTPRIGNSASSLKPINPAHRELCFFAPAD